MLRIILIPVILSTLMPSMAYSLDEIHLYDGKIIRGFVKYVDVNKVTIIDYENIERKIHKSYIKVIIYENGNTETFPEFYVVDEMASRRKFAFDFAIFLIIVGIIGGIIVCATA